MAVAGKHRVVMRVMSKRRWSQVASLLALNSSLWGMETQWPCWPVLNCHSCALAWFACPVGVFTQYAGLHVFPFLAVGMILLAGALVGRLLCGWACPFGLVQDLLYKIPSRKLSLPAWTSKLKYAVLALGVLALPWIFGGETLASFCRVCPAAHFQWPATRRRPTRRPDRGPGRSGTAPAAAAPSRRSRHKWATDR